MSATEETTLEAEYVADEEPDADEERDEGEQDEGEQTGDVEAEAPAPPLSEREVEKALKRLHDEAQRHARRVGEIMGDDATSLAVCPLCEPDIPGFLWPGAIDQDRETATLALLGATAPDEYRPDPDAQTCDLCDGLGETLTGSRVPEQRTKVCPKCSANGWTSSTQRTEWEAREGAIREAARIAAPPPPPAAPVNELPPFDAWTRPVGHPFYGRNPVYMTAADREADWHGAK